LRIFKLHGLKPKSRRESLKGESPKWRSLKYIIALWVAISSYSLSSFLFGDMGLAAYDELGAELGRQQANIAALRQINGELEDLKDSLLYDETAIALYARELGYGRKNESFIRIPGIDGNLKPPLDAGELIPIVKQAHNPDILLKIIACSTGLGVLFLMEIAGLLNRRR
jgi:cell division protein FtsB